ncbi:MAG TPA: sulfur carrier protein ThiS [Actinomycetota bacterium]|nr:sulfur carrier protein ThiS [Actinomycetota bacterium]
MNAVVNGKPIDLPVAVTVAELVVEAGHDPRGFGIAVALNGSVLHRSEWGSTSVHEGDKVEILVASQGG